MKQYPTNIMMNASFIMYGMKLLGYDVMRKVVSSMIWTSTIARAVPVVHWYQHGGGCQIKGGSNHDSPSSVHTHRGLIHIQ